MDTAQWPQGIGVVKGVDDEITTSKKPRPPQKEQSINCPRCNSTNTKFCYYNNYSLSQPRYFCKTCRRYWTEGGSLRNVPVGGGSRKNNKRSSSSSSSSYSSSSAKKAVLPDHLSRPNLLDQNHKIHHDLNLAYNPPHHHHNPFNGVISDFAVEPFGGLDGKNSISTSHHQQFPVMEFLKTGNISDLNSNPVYNSSGFPDFKPSLGFSIDGLGNGYGNLHGVEDHHANNNNASRNVLFPFEELKPVSNNDHGETNGFWSGMLNGGSW